MRAGALFLCLLGTLGFAYLYILQRQPHVYPELGVEMAVGTILVRVPRDWKVTELPFPFGIERTISSRDPGRNGDTSYQRSLSVTVRDFSQGLIDPDYFPIEPEAEGEPVVFSEHFSGRMLTRDREIDERFTAAGILDRSVRVVGRTRGGTTVTIQAQTLSRSRDAELRSMQDLVMRVAKTVRDMPDE